MAVKSGIDWCAWTGRLPLKPCVRTQARDHACIYSCHRRWGRTFGRPSANVLVQRITVGTTHGLSIGSEMSGGVNNVTFQDIVVTGAPFTPLCSRAALLSRTSPPHLVITLAGASTGIHIKSQRGRGGVVEDILYRNISIIQVRQ